MSSPDVTTTAAEESGVDECRAGQVELRYERVSYEAKGPL